MPDASPYQLLQVFGLQNVNVLLQRDYQISGPPQPNVQLPAGNKDYTINRPAQMPDAKLYTGPLLGPVMSDITLGDTRNAANNQWTDAAGRTRSFNPQTYATVIIKVAQEKQIVKTMIQGRDTGTVKEYIGMGDYQITISGIICGANGVYPKDDVTALKTILDAPIAIVVTGWYLQLLGIYSIVVDSYDIGQTEGGYSYQPFQIRASSDTPTELKII